MNKQDTDANMGHDDPKQMIQKFLIAPPFVTGPPGVNFDMPSGSTMSVTLDGGPLSKGGGSTIDCPMPS